MPDEHPYGPPRFYTQAEITYFMSTIGGLTPDPNIMGAIAIAESSGDAAVVNNTPSTGDYSVGLFQINYFDGLYDSRVRQFGTPAQLVAGGLSRQGNAAVVIWREDGYHAWSTYTNGAYLKYYGPPAATGPPQSPGQQTAPLSPPIGQGIDAWDGQVRETAALVSTNARTALEYSRAIDSI